MGLLLEVIWFDDDLIEVRVRCHNGRFAGAADLYIGHSAFADFYAAIRGFPASSDDRREFDLGTFEPGYAGGGLRLGLRCLVRSGRSAADVLIRSPYEVGAIWHEETPRFSFPVEAAAIDEFAATIGKLQIAVGATVGLRQAT